MTFIEGISDDVVTIWFVLVTILTLIVSWLSTYVRDLAVPGNLYVVERRSRHPYATNFVGNFNRIIASQRLTASTTTTTSTTINSETGSNSEVINNEARSSSDNDEVVNETVENALVENLLEGTIYTAADIGVQNESILNFNDLDRPAAAQELNTIETPRSLPDTNLVEASQESNQTVENIANPDSTVELAEESSSQTPMNISIRFVTEKEIKIQANPNDTILFLKRTHFSQELSGNKIVRFIYQGQFLCDKNTVKSYNIRDHTTIHCHITSKQPRADLGVAAAHNNAIANPPPQHTPVATNNLRQRIQTHQISTIARITGISARDGTNYNNPTLTNVEPPSSPTTDTHDNNYTENSTANTIQPELAANEQLETAGNNNNNNTTTNLSMSTIIRIDLSYFLLPLFALLIAGLWYFRINFKHFFSPLSTLILFVFTFVYSIFLINNINSASIPTVRFYLNNRLWPSANNNTQQTPEVVVATDNNVIIPSENEIVMGN